MPQPQLSTPCSALLPVASQGSPKGAAAGGIAPGKDHGARGPPQLSISPSMEHLASLSNVQSSASVASLASAAGGEEAAPLLGPAAASRVPVLLPR